MHILLVEDNDYLRQTILELLEAPGREVLACATAELAIAALKVRPVDVLMTDVNLPGRSGIDLVRSVLREQPEHWIVFCSGYTFSAEMLALGRNVRTLTKPFELAALDALFDEIDQHLRLCKLQHQAAT